jgi:hypothetical protein
MSYISESIRQRFGFPSSETAEQQFDPKRHRINEERDLTPPFLTWRIESSDV